MVVYFSVIIYTHSLNPCSRPHMSGLLSHLSDEPGNNGNISVRRKTDSDMTVDLYRYYIASFCRKKTCLLEDHIFERYLLGPAGTHTCRPRIAGQPGHA